MLAATSLLRSFKLSPKRGCSHEYRFRQVHVWELNIRTLLTLDDYLTMTQMPPKHSEQVWFLQGFGFQVCVRNKVDWIEHEKSTRISEHAQNHSSEVVMVYHCSEGLVERPLQGLSCK